MQTKPCNVCGGCTDFFETGKCGNPMVYLNHGDNVHKTTQDTKACGFFYPIKKKIIRQ